MFRVFRQLYLDLCTLILAGSIFYRETYWAPNYVKKSHKFQSRWLGSQNTERDLHFPWFYYQNREKTNKHVVQIEESRRILGGLPTLTMVKPKKRMRRQRSQPNPVLSGQFTVITLVAPSPSLSASFIITTSSHSIPIIFFFKIKSKQQTLEPWFNCY